MSPGRPTSKPWTAVAAVALFAVLLAAACEDDPQAGGQSPAQKRVLAPIERVTIRSVGTPLSYVATIVSGLPTGCARFDGFVIARSGEAINISVSNRMPADETVACAMVYGTRETSVPLGGDFVAGRTYTVVVNDTHRTTFTAQLIPQIGEPTAALLGVPFQIGLGQAALINAEALEVRFAEVLEDSRGPLDVTCVQAGRVRALFLVSQAGAVLGTLELGLGPGQGEPAAGNAGRYTLSLIALDPHRRAANGSNRTPYMATLSVSRAHVQALRGGMLATFTVGEESYRVWATNQPAIAALQALRDRRTALATTTGPLRSGPGPGGHNAPWNGHFDPGRVVILEQPPDVCAADAPRQVVSDNWPGVAHLPCYWVSELVELEDLR